MKIRTSSKRRRPRHQRRQHFPRLSHHRRRQEARVTDFVHFPSPSLSYELLSRRRTSGSRLQGPRGDFHFMSAPRSHLRRRRGRRPAVHSRTGSPVARQARPQDRLLLHQRRPHRASALAPHRRQGRLLQRSRPALSPHGLSRRARIDLADVSGTLPRHPEARGRHRHRQGRPPAAWAPGPTPTASPTPSVSGELAIKYAKEGVTGGRSFRRHFKKEDVFEAYNAATPRSTWSGGYYMDVATGKEKKNHVLVFETCTSSARATCT